MSAVREAVGAWRNDRATVAFVPTMGNLHAGHLSLVRLAAQSADRVVVSIFVNPTQFGVGEDFAAYPRTLKDDTALLRGTGSADLLFVPEDREMYPFGLDEAIRVVLPALSDQLCGASRPGHFNGVASVVCRLLNIVVPDILVLGQKDYQQFVLLERMIADLRLPVRVRMGATYREADGLAMSSRNRYLDAAQRRQAPALHAALEGVGDALRAGSKDYERLTAVARDALVRAGFLPEYMEVRRAADLGVPTGQEPAEQLIVLGAARLGRARLIDNVRV